MANEFIIKNGYRSQGNSEITGSAIVSGSVNITGSLSVLDANGINRLNTIGYTLRGASPGNLSVDWNDRLLYDASGITVVNWRNQRLIDSNTTHSINWNTRSLITTLGNTTVEWDSAKLNDTTGGNKISINWNTRKLYDSSTTESADWRVRTLTNSSGTTILDWQSAQFTGTSSYSTQAVSSSYALSASWAPSAGSQGNIQFNNGGSFGSNAALSYNTGSQSLTNGSGAIATGNFSHAEGSGTATNAEGSHAEGRSTTTNGNYSHAEGYSTITHGIYSHAEGYTNTSSGSYSHVEGKSNITYGAQSHAEGEFATTGEPVGYLATITTPGVVILNSIYGDQTAFFAPPNIVSIDDSAYDNTIGYRAYTSMISSSYDGTNTSLFLYDTALATTSASILSITGLGSNAGTYVVGGQGAHTEGSSTKAIGFYSHAEGNSAYALGNYSHAEGSGYAYGDYSHAEGSSTYPYGPYAHTEGFSTYAYGNSAHAEGLSTIAGYNALTPKTAISSGVFELAIEYGDLTTDFPPGTLILIRDDQGDITPGIPTTHILEVLSSTYTGIGGVTEITLTTNTTTTTDKYTVGIYGAPYYSRGTVTMGDTSHAEGVNTQAIGQSSHATGNDTRALGWYQSVVGQFNNPISNVSAFIVGDGVDDTTRHNLLVADSGNVTISGSLLVSGSITSTSGIRTKANVVAYSSFTGTPLTATVTFATPFDSSNYAVTVTGEDARSWTVTGKTTSGFDINSNSSVALIGDTYWQATSYGEFNG